MDSCWRVGGSEAVEVDPNADEGGDRCMCFRDTNCHAVGWVEAFLPLGGNCTANVAGKLGAFGCALGKTSALDMVPETTLQALH